MGRKTGLKREEKQRIAELLSHGKPVWIFQY